MTIFNKSKMDINTSVRIKPIKIQHEGVEGNYGIQDQWYVKINGEDATTYTGYKDGEKDWHGNTLVAAMENDLELVMDKTFNKSTNHPKYDYNPVRGQSATPPTKAAQTATQAPKTAFVARRDTKSIKIGFYACLKVAASLPQTTLAQLIADAKTIFASADVFSETYRRDLDKIQDKMNVNKVPALFWNWLCTVNGVHTKQDLTLEATAYTLKEFGTVVKRYVDSLKPTPDGPPQQDEDIHREQSAAEVAPEPGKGEGSWEDVISGPEDTGYPEPHDGEDVVPDPGESDEMPPF